MEKRCGPGSDEVHYFPYLVTLNILGKKKNPLSLTFKFSQNIPSQRNVSSVNNFLVGHLPQFLKSSPVGCQAFSLKPGPLLYSIHLSLPTL